MKKSSLAVFAFALLAAAAPFAALLAPPTTPAPLVQADDLSPAATPQGRHPPRMPHWPQRTSPCTTPTRAASVW